MNDQNNLIFKTQNFLVERAPQPFVSREEGGHIRIFPKDETIRSINDLKPQAAIELIRLEMVVREAMIEGMNRQGVPVVWVNIEDLANWAFKTNSTPRLHIHVFGRSKTATKQKWPEAVYLPDRSTGFYEGFTPLPDEDMKVIAEIMESIFQRPEFSDKSWGLTFD